MATGNRRRRLLRRKQKARELHRLCAMYQRLVEAEAYNRRLEQVVERAKEIQWKSDHFKLSPDGQEKAA